ncbi:MAG: DpnI domain-containing protein [Candidatus Velthaea sp.]
MASGQGGGNVPWPVAVSFLIRPLPDVFSLPEVYAIADPLRKAFPNNHHVNAKIRQSLQILRDRGEIVFEGSGRYRKVQLAVARSVRLDFGEAASYASRAQVARVAIEAWVGRNIDCRRCGSSLLLVPPNTKLMDAVCRCTGHEVQVKAISGVASDRLTAAAFAPMAQRLADGPLPDYLLVSYDRPRSVVLLAEFIDGADLIHDRLKARQPLREGARRAGWVGATINFAGLERHTVVGPSFEPEVTSWS